MMPARVPSKYALSDTCHAHHLQDAQFELPKAVIGVSVFSPFTAESPRNMMLTELFAQCLAEDLNEFAYDAELAGLSYKMAATNRGFELEVGGYDDKLHVLLKEIAHKIASGGSGVALGLVFWEKLSLLFLGRFVTVKMVCSFLKSQFAGDSGIQCSPSFSAVQH